MAFNMSNLERMSMTCPSCGAEMTVDAEFQQAVCNYCGHSVLLGGGRHKVEFTVPNARQIGYDLEAGKINARQDANCAKRADTARIVSRLGAYISIYDDLVSYSAKADELDNKRQKMEKMKNKNAALICVTLIPLALVFLGGGMPMLRLFWLCASIAGLRFIWKQLAYRAVVKRVEQNAKQVVKMVDERDVGIFVESRLTKEQAQFAQKALATGQASTLGEALTLHQLQLQNKQQMQKLKLYERSLDEKESDRKALVKGAVAVGAGIFLGARSIAKSRK